MSRCLSSALQSRLIYCLSAQVCVNALFWPELGSEPVPLLRSLFPVVSWHRGVLGLFGSCFGEHRGNPGCGRTPGGTGPGKAGEGSPGALGWLLRATSALLGRLWL